MLIEFVRWGGKLICCCCSIAKKIFLSSQSIASVPWPPFFNLDTEKNVKCCEKCQKVWSVLDIWAWEMKTLLQETIATRYRFSYWRRRWHCRKSDTAQVFVETRPIKSMGSLLREESKKSIQHKGSTLSSLIKSQMLCQLWGAKAIRCQKSQRVFMKCGSAKFSKGILPAVS